MNEIVKGMHVMGVKGCRNIVEEAVSLEAYGGGQGLLRQLTTASPSSRNPPNVNPVTFHQGVVNLSSFFFSHGIRIP